MTSRVYAMSSCCVSLFTEAVALGFTDSGLLASIMPFVYAGLLLLPPLTALFPLAGDGMDDGVPMLYRGFPMATVMEVLLVGVVATLPSMRCASCRRPGSVPNVDSKSRWMRSRALAYPSNSRHTLLCENSISISPGRAPGTTGDGWDANTCDARAPHKHRETTREMGKRPHHWQTRWERRRTVMNRRVACSSSDSAAVFALTARSLAPDCDHTSGHTYTLGVRKAPTVMLCAIWCASQKGMSTGSLGMGRTREPWHVTRPLAIALAVSISSADSVNSATPNALLCAARVLWCLWNRSVTTDAESVGDSYPPSLPPAPLLLPVVVEAAPAPAPRSPALELAWEGTHA